MNFEFFIAKRIHFSKEKGTDKRVTPPVIRIAMAGVAVGLAVMIMAVAIVVGFKKEVRNKVIGFGSHIQLTNFDNNISFEAMPIAVSDSLRHAIGSFKGVRHIEVFATKPGMLKTETDFQGIVLKGMDADFDTAFFKSHLVEGRMIKIDSSKMSNQALVSRTTARLLHLSCGDSFLAYFINNREVRARKFDISGIYDTGFADYDRLFVICDIKHIRRLNGWESDMVGGVNIFIDDYEQLDRMSDELYFSFIDRKDRLGNTYYIRSIKELNQMIFNWLGVLDSNVVLLLVLMIIVSGFTMISGLLIIILERTNMIGVLKALGESNYSIRKIFLYVSFFLIIKGMFWGNITGLALCLLQSHFHWFKLDPATYYLDSVPVDLNLFSFLLINIGTLAVSMLMMIAPSYLISKIEPAKSIRFE
ncbi:MAG: ABC transporter permease [Tannerella sp.]|jgi:lipoprotein-releasing system permease protein|nr:ABC transporter permease [Tannerella sp.]